MAIQTLKKTRLQKCLIGCSIEDIDSSVHVVEVNLLSQPMLLPVYMCSTAVYRILFSKCKQVVLCAAWATCSKEGRPREEHEALCAGCNARHASPCV